MMPLALTRGLSVILAGAGEAGRKRFTFLSESGLEALRVFWTGPGAPSGSEDGLPDQTALAGARVLFVAGLPRAVGETLAAQARAARVLVNVEDENDLCDFHVPSVLRRGALTVALSTGGAAPFIASSLRKALGELIGPEWALRLREAEALRRTIRARGGSAADVKAALGELAAQGRWFTGLTPPPP